MRRLLLLSMFLAAACGNKNTIGDALDGDGEADLDGREDHVEQRDPDAVEEVSPDLMVDEAQDMPLDDGAHEPLTCPDAIDDGTVELTPIAPSRPAMPCGPSCRQVSFAESMVYSYHVDVEERYLVFSTGGTGATPDITRVWLVDLWTLDQYILHEENLGFPLEPAVGYPSMDGAKVDYLYVCLEVEGVRDRIIYSVLSFDMASCTRTEVWRRLYERQDPCEYPVGPAQLEYEGHYLAWWDGRVCTEWGGQAFLYDMETTEERLLSPDGCCASFVEMEGNWVVWEQGVPGSGIQIWVHDIARNESRPLTSGSLDKFGPYIYGNKVTWTECVAAECTKYDGFSADIMMMDIATGVVTPITSDVHLQAGSILGNDIVVWGDCRNDPENSAECWNRQVDVYMKDLSNGEESRLTDLPGYEVPVAIWGNKVYFLTMDLDNILSVFEIML